MKVLMISGSRNPDGQTAAAAKAFLKGVENAGAESELILLPELKIERCRQCDDSGWGLCITECRCVIEDDFAAVAEGIRSADAVVFATPVYFSDLSESLRAFLDRLRRTCWQKAGEEGIAGKQAAGICVAGGGGGGAPTCAANLEKILHTCRFDVVDMVPARRQNLEMKLDVLETVGKWFVESAEG